MVCNPAKKNTTQKDHFIKNSLSMYVNGITGINMQEGRWSSSSTIFTNTELGCFVSRDVICTVYFTIKGLILPSDYRRSLTQTQ